MSDRKGGSQFWPGKGGADAVPLFRSDTGDSKGKAGVGRRGEEDVFQFECVEFGAPSAYPRGSQKHVSAVLFVLTYLLFDE